MIVFLKLSSQNHLRKISDLGTNVYKIVEYKTSFIISTFEIDVTNLFLFCLVLACLVIDLRFVLDDFGTKLPKTCYSEWRRWCQHTE